MATDAIVAKRTANALIADAQPVLPAMMPRADQVSDVLDRFKSAHGGLWVGGRATLTTASVCFHPNAVNSIVTTGSLDLEIPLSDIVSVEVVPAFVTRIIVIQAFASIVKIRCFRADAFAKSIDSQRFA